MFQDQNVTSPDLLPSCETFSYPPVKSSPTLLLNLLLPSVTASQALRSEVERQAGHSNGVGEVARCRRRSQNLQIPGAWSQRQPRAVPHPIAPALSHSHVQECAGQRTMRGASVPEKIEADRLCKTADFGVPIDAGSDAGRKRGIEHIARECQAKPQHTAG